LSMNFVRPNAPPGDPGPQNCGGDRWPMTRAEQGSPVAGAAPAASKIRVALVLIGFG
jgi:hypothetical protein